jgi:hypothetical protein
MSPSRCACAGRTCCGGRAIVMRHLENGSKSCVDAGFSWVGGHCWVDQLVRALQAAPPHLACIPRVGSSLDIDLSNVSVTGLRSRAWSWPLSSSLGIDASTSYSRAASRSCDSVVETAWPTVKSWALVMLCKGEVSVHPIAVFKPLVAPAAGQGPALLFLRAQPWRVLLLRLLCRVRTPRFSRERRHLPLAHLYGLALGVPWHPEVGEQDFAAFELLVACRTG